MATITPHFGLQCGPALELPAIGHKALVWCRGEVTLMQVVGTRLSSGGAVIACVHDGRVHVIPADRVTRMSEL